MSEIKFADGINFKFPSQNMPDFIKGTISIKAKEALIFIEENQDNGWLNIDVKESKAGKLYCSLNTYNRDRQNNNQGQQQNEYNPKTDPKYKNQSRTNEFGDDIPF
jgi:hypothetical protein